MSDSRTVAIVGLGLIGGSLARDLAARGVRVLAFDNNAAALRGAVEEGVVAAALPQPIGNLEAVDVLVIATPVDVATGILVETAVRLPPHAIITDVCSTKHTLERAAIELGLGSRFVGGHPLAGDVCSGWTASREGLFAGAPVYLCPTPQTGDDAMRVVRELWAGIGAVPEIMAAADHDHLLASTSHLPQFTATALARVLKGAGIPFSRLGPGGRDMTRLAGSSSEVWTAIALDNRLAITSAVRRLEAELVRLRSALEAQDAEAVRRFLSLDTY